MTAGTSVTDTGGHFDAALAGTATHLELADGRWLPLCVDRWQDRARRADRWLLGQCHGPTLDLGCGPGRLVEALADKGFPALGVDSCARAVDQCRERGAPAVRADLFGPLPREGRWQHALLADGNIGIGGDPLRLLRRAAALIRRGGSVLMELTPRHAGMWRGTARVRGRGCLAGPWFAWALLGVDVLPGLAHRAGLRVSGTCSLPDRQFAALVREGPADSGYS